MNMLKEGIEGGVSNLARAAFPPGQHRSEAIYRSSTPNLLPKGTG
jgi:hypothetical protein